MMVEGWVCRKGWDSRHQSHHHLHWSEGLSSVQGTYSYGGYGVSWQEDATEVSCGQTTVVFYVRGRNLILFFCMLKGCLQVVSTSSSILPLMSLQPQELLRKVAHLVTGQSVQSSWVGPWHWIHEASQIWQWPCSSMYSPGEQNLAVYLISTWEQPDPSVAMKKQWRQFREKRHWMTQQPVLNPDLRCCCSVAKSRPTLGNTVNWSMPGFPVLHYLPEFAQTHVHWVSDAIQLSHPLLSPSPPAFYLSQYQSLSQWVSSSHQVAKVLELQLQHQSFQWILRVDFLYSYNYYFPTGPRS